MLPLLLLALPVQSLAAVDKTHGVGPALLSRYQYPGDDAAPWTCLDGSKTVTWASVNDDYCDCPDGSDEPGTGACPNAIFYCKNEGHIGSFIPSTHVGDGLCEPECCDGSDESPGVCPNVCKEVGAAYREKQQVELKTRKTGSKIRSLYISWAQKEKKRLEGEMAATQEEINEREQEVARLKDLADRAESLSAAALDYKKESPLYVSLETHAAALKSLQRVHAEHLARERALGDILDALRRGYNPNYQDMAVLEAVRGWEALAGLPHINDVGKDGAEAEAQEEVKEEVKLAEGEWSEEKLDKELDKLLKTDYEALLPEHEKHISGADGTSVLFDLNAYLPDDFVPYYDAARDTLVSWLELFGIARRTGSAGGDTSRARKAFTDAEKELEKARKEQQKTKEELERLFDPSWFGTEGEWAKLKGTCLSKDTGDYTYELCWFQDAKQKPNKGGSSQNLGKYSSWNNAPSIEPGTPAYYSKQHYTRGAKCWNGPQRSATVLLSCGTENELVSIAEPEKCEYQFTVTTPAMCLPLTEEEQAIRDEL